MHRALTISCVFFDIEVTLVDCGKQWIGDALATLAGLRAKRIRLGLISNTATLTRDEILGRLPTDFDLALFEPELVLFSSEIGIEKPDVRIFELAARRAHTTPTQCLFCTEDDAHVTAALNAGFKAMRVASAQAMQTLVSDLEAAGLLKHRSHRPRTRH